MLLHERGTNMSNQYDIEVGLISKILESGDFLAVKEKQITLLKRLWELKNLLISGVMK